MYLQILRVYESDSLFKATGSREFLIDLIDLSGRLGFERSESSGDERPPPSESALTIGSRALECATIIDEWRSDRRLIGGTPFGISSHIYQHTKAQQTYSIATISIRFEYLSDSLCLFVDNGSAGTGGENCRRLTRDTITHILYILHAYAHTGRDKTRETEGHDKTGKSFDNLIPNPIFVASKVSRIIAYISVQ